MDRRRQSVGTDACSLSPSPRELRLPDGTGAGARVSACRPSDWVQYSKCWICLLLLYVISIYRVVIIIKWVTSAPHHPSSISLLYCRRPQRASTDQLELICSLPWPTSNLCVRTVRVLALPFPPACVGCPLNLLQAPQPLCGPGSAASSTCPLSSLGFPHVHCRPLCARG